MLPFRRCADRFTLVFYDHRCNGRSEGAPVESMTWENLTADADELRKQLGFDRWAVLGHSFGGRSPSNTRSVSGQPVASGAARQRRGQPLGTAERSRPRSQAGYGPKKAELVRRWFNGELEPKEWLPIFMRIGRTPTSTARASRPPAYSAEALQGGGAPSCGPRH